MRWLLIIAVLLSEICMAATPSAAEKFVDSIKTTGQVKQIIRDALNANCASGSCEANNAKQVCAAVGALDVQAGGVVSGGGGGSSTVPIAIPPTDLQLMKSIWTHCRPSAYQYWNRQEVLVVVYEPDAATDALVRKMLNARSRGAVQPHSSLNPPVSNQATIRADVVAPMHIARTADVLFLRTQTCMRETGVVLRRHGINSESELAAQALTLCSGPVAKFLTLTVGRPADEVAALLEAMSRVETRSPRIE